MGMGAIGGDCGWWVLNIPFPVPFVSFSHPSHDGLRLFVPFPSLKVFKNYSYLFFNFFLFPVNLEFLCPTCFSSPVLTSLFSVS